MTKGLISTLGLGLVASLTAAAYAAPVVIVFEDAAAARDVAGTTVSGTPITYTKFPYWSTSGTGYTDLKDITGAATTIDVKAVVTGVGNLANVLTSTPTLSGEAATIFPDAARSRGVYTTSTTTYATVAITGLDTGSAYNFDLFAVRDGVGSTARIAEYLGTGQNTVGPMAGVSCNQNGSVVTHMLGVIPDATGQIVLGWRLLSTSSGSGALSAFQVSAVPEPATMGLLGLSSLTLMIRRRAKA